MLKLIPDLPASVVGIEAVGKVEAVDYQRVLDPAAAQAIEARRKVRTYPASQLDAARAWVAEEAGTRRPATPDRGEDPR